MIKIVTVIGARPQIIKSAAISRQIRENFKAEIEEIIIHTGQHYDANMSDVFFNELGIPRENYNLRVGSASHGKQTADMLAGIEGLIQKEMPDYLLVYGDTNSTLAGALAAVKTGIPVIHVEAGLRSFNKSMPEEINRIVTDHSSTFLFSPTQTAVNNLRDEGLINSKAGNYSVDNPAVFNSGDIMLDNAQYYSKIASSKSTILNNLGINEKEFVLVTVHRESNTNDETRLRNIFNALIDLSEKHKMNIVMPLHPRTILALKKNSGLYNRLLHLPLFKIIEPVSFLDMIKLETNCSMIMTDSGGVQKEAYFYGKGCVIFRDETEWIEIVEAGAAICAGTDNARIVSAYEKLLPYKMRAQNELFGNGNAAAHICNTILKAHYR